MAEELWMFNHYAQGPDLPGGTRHYDFAIELSKKGYNVTVFASGFHHVLSKDVVNYNKHGFCEEKKNGIKFIWVKTFPYYSNGWKRMVNIISYSYQLFRIIPKLNIKLPKFIIGSTVHPFAPIVALHFSKKYNSKYILEIRDLWPQTFIDMKIWKKSSMKSSFFKFLEKISVKESDKIIVLSPLTVDYLREEYNYKDSNIILLPNGVNKAYINKNLEDKNSDKISITYLGGIEKVHGLEFLIDLAKLIKDPRIEFDIYGDGKQKKILQQRMLDNDVKNVFWHGSVPKSEVPKVLSNATLLFVSTSNVLYGSENKLYDYMASAKPIVLAVEGSHNNPIDTLGCGISLNRDDVEGAASELISFISTKKSDFLKLGLIGQDYVIKNRTVDLLVEKLLNFIEKN